MEPREKILCSIQNCNKKGYARGYCAMHYSRFMKYGDPLYCKRPNVNRHPPEKCTVEGCNKPYKARGFCINHLAKARDAGILPGQKKCGVNDCDKKQ